MASGAAPGGSPASEASATDAPPALERAPSPAGTSTEAAPPEDATEPPPAAAAQVPSVPAAVAALPDPPRAAPVVRVGPPVRVWVKTKPWGHVQVDGGPRHTTDQWLDAVPSGQRVLSLHASDGRQRDWTVQLAPDVDHRLCWDFDQDAPCY